MGSLKEVFADWWKTIKNLYHENRKECLVSFLLLQEILMGCMWSIEYLHLFITVYWTSQKCCYWLFIEQREKRPIATWFRLLEAGSLVLEYKIMTRDII